MAIDEQELDDASLVEAAQGGDEEAFSELFRRHYPTVRRVCARRLGNVSEADEVAQAAFVRAYERIGQCGGERRFGAWVQVIAYRMGADARRDRARSTPTDERLVLDTALGPNHCEEAVLRAEQADEVQRALATLPPRQRQVIIARDLEGRRPGEIAASLGLSLGAVDSLLLRARRRMAKTWRGRRPEVGGVTAPVALGAVVGSVAVGSVGAGSFTGFSALRAAVGLSALRAAPAEAARVVHGLTDALSSGSYRLASTLGLLPGAAAVGPCALAQCVGGVAVAGVLMAAPTGVISLPAAPPAPRPGARPALGVPPTVTSQARVAGAGASRPVDGTGATAVTVAAMTIPVPVARPSGPGTARAAVVHAAPVERGGTGLVAQVTKPALRSVDGATGKVVGHLDATLSSVVERVVGAGRERSGVSSLGTLPRLGGAPDEGVAGRQGAPARSAAQKRNAAAPPSTP